MVLCSFPSENVLYVSPNVRGCYVLKERVRIYRWSAVIAGFVGVIVMLIPHFDLSHYAGLALHQSLPSDLRSRSLP
jgi:drug/metabolite transporter (DMT)-like permease